MKTTIKVIAIAVLGFLAFTAATLAFAESLKSDIDSMRPDTPSEGIGRVYTADATLYAAPTAQAESGTALRVWCETDENLPAWFKPDEEMSVEWYAQEPVKDIASPDWNLNTTIWGWNGHGMEVWEMDLLSRIVYLEFNGTEPECMNAGIDSILNLWDSRYFGRTLFDTLSATAENGALVYTTYGYVWDWDYDYSILAEIKTLCQERFIAGPQYGCHFFQLYGFPWWAQPLYEIDHVYFSTFKGGK